MTEQTSSHTRSRYNPFIRVMAFILIASFLGAELSHAAPALNLAAFNDLSHNPSLLKISEDNAKISDVYKGQNGRLLIHIQDAHMNVSAQSNIAKVLEEVIKRYKVKTIFVEGGTKDDSLNFLRPLASRDVREQVAKKYLMTGELKGSEYLNLSSDYDMQLWGVEEEDLYQQNLKNYASIVRQRDSVLSYIEEISKRVDSLKRRLFSKEILEFDDFLEKFENKEKDFTEYYSYLCSLSQIKHINLLGYPNFLSLDSLKKSEEKIDFKKANLEQQALLRALTSSVDTDTEIIRNLFSDLSKLKSSDVNKFSYYEELLTHAKNAGIRVESYPNLLSYIQYLKSYSGIDLTRLDSETRLLQEEIYRASLESKDAVYLHEISDYLKTLHTLFSLKISKKDFDGYVARQKDVRFNSFVFLGFLNKQLSALGNYADVVEYSDRIDANKKAVEDFYFTNQKRDEVFVEKALYKMQTENTEVAVLITGGYHTSNLTSLLQKANASYVVLSPFVGEETDFKKYEEMLLGQLGNENPLKEKQFASKGSLSAFAERVALERPDSPLARIREDIATLAASRLVKETPARVVGSRLALTDKLKNVHNKSVRSFVEKELLFLNAGDAEIVGVPQVSGDQSFDRALKEQERQLEEAAIAAGEVYRTADGQLLARSHPDDTARSEDKTTVAIDHPWEKGAYNNGKSSKELDADIDREIKGSYQGKKAYVVPYLMGSSAVALRGLMLPLKKGSFLNFIRSIENIFHIRLTINFGQTGVEITSSPYVALNLIRMSKVGQQALDAIGNSNRFVKGVHSPGDLDKVYSDKKAGNDRRFFALFPKRRTIYSFGSNYGGNALLPKKFHALRQAMYDGYKEGWLAEHMLIVGIQDMITGKTKYIAAAFPSASGKTNLSMLIPPDALKDRYRVWLVGDDIAWLRKGKDGRLYAINPENGFFGVAPGTSYDTNPNAMEAVKHNSIFTNVAYKLNEKTGIVEDYFWEGKLDKDGKKNFPDMESEEYLNGTAKWRNWKGELITAENKDQAWAQANSRFTTPIEEAPNWIGHAANLPEKERPEYWNHWEGVPITTILWGGRAQTEPLVRELANPIEGIYDGWVMGVQTTAAAENLDPYRRDPAANRPFISPLESQYAANQIRMMKSLGKKAPKFFHVNWFRKSEQGKGKIIWPGYGENLRVLLWALARSEGVRTPLGLIPPKRALNWSGLESFTDEQWASIASLNKDEVIAEMGFRRKHLEDLMNKTPLEEAYRLSKKWFSKPAYILPKEIIAAQFEVEKRVEDFYRSSALRGARLALPTKEKMIQIFQDAEARREYMQEPQFPAYFNSDLRTILSDPTHSKQDILDFIKAMLEIVHENKISGEDAWDVLFKMFDTLKQNNIQDGEIFTAMDELVFEMEELEMADRKILQQRSAFIEQSFLDAFGLTDVPSYAMDSPTYRTAFFRIPQYFIDSKKNWSNALDIPDTLIQGLRKTMGLLNEAFKEAAYDAEFEPSDISDSQLREIAVRINSEYALKFSGSRLAETQKLSRLKRQLGALKLRKMGLATLAAGEITEHERMAPGRFISPSTQAKQELVKLNAHIAELEKQLRKLREDAKKPRHEVILALMYETDAQQRLATSESDFHALERAIRSVRENYDRDLNARELSLMLQWSGVSSKLAADLINRIYSSGSRLALGAIGEILYEAIRINGSDLSVKIPSYLVFLGESTVSLQIISQETTSEVIGSVGKIHLKYAVNVDQHPSGYTRLDVNVVEGSPVIAAWDSEHVESFDHDDLDEIVLQQAIDGFFQGLWNQQWSPENPALQSGARLAQWNEGYEAAQKVHEKASVHSVYAINAFLTAIAYKSAGRPDVAEYWSGKEAGHRFMARQLSGAASYEKIDDAELLPYSPKKVKKVSRAHFWFFPVLASGSILIAIFSGILNYFRSNDEPDEDLPTIAPEETENVLPLRPLQDLLADLKNTPEAFSKQDSVLVKDFVRTGEPAIKDLFDIARNPEISEKIRTLSVKAISGIVRKNIAAQVLLSDEIKKALADVSGVFFAEIPASRKAPRLPIDKRVAAAKKAEHDARKEFEDKILGQQDTDVMDVTDSKGRVTEKKVTWTFEGLVRTVQREAIIKIGRENAFVIPVVAESLNNKSSNIRLDAVSILAGMGDKSAASYLKPLLNDEKESVRTATQKAIQTLESPAPTIITGPTRGSRLAIGEISPELIERILNSNIRYFTMLGRPGAGKGTIVDYLLPLLNSHLPADKQFVTLTMGDYFRGIDAVVKGKANESQKIEYKQFADLIPIEDLENMAAGKLMTDDTAVKIVNAVLKLDRYKNAYGIFFDGFPRTPSQAKLVDDGQILINGEPLKFDLQVILDSDEEVLFKRILNRAVQDAKKGEVRPDAPLKDDGQVDEEATRANFKRRMADFDNFTSKVVEQKRSDANTIALLGYAEGLSQDEEKAAVRETFFTKLNEWLDAKAGSRLAIPDLDTQLANFPQTEAIGSIQRILVNEDDRAVAYAMDRVLRSIFSSQEVDIVLSSTSEQAWDILEHSRVNGQAVNVLITDGDLGAGISGPELIKKLRTSEIPEYNLPVLLTSGNLERVLERSQLNIQALGPKTIYLPKPFSINQIERFVNVVSRGSRLAQDDDEILENSRAPRLAVPYRLSEIPLIDSRRALRNLTQFISTTADSRFLRFILARINKESDFPVTDADYTNFLYKVQSLADQNLRIRGQALDDVLILLKELAEKRLVEIYKSKGSRLAAVKILFADEPAGKEVTLGAVREAVQPLGENVTVLTQVGIGKDKELLRQAILADKPAIIVVRSDTKAFLDETFLQFSFENGLRVIIRAGAGTENINKTAAAQYGVQVIATGGNDEAVGELSARFALAGVLLKATQDVKDLADNPEIYGLKAELDQYWKADAASAKKGRGKTTDAQLAFIFSNISPRSFKERVAPIFKNHIVGLIGFGKTAQSFALKLRGLFGQSFYLMAYSPSLAGAGERKLRAKDLNAASIASRETVLSQASILSFHLPGDEGNALNEEEEKALLGNTNLRILINTSRFNLIDATVLRALARRGIKIFLDVDFNEEVQALVNEFPDNVYATPHIAASTKLAADGVEEALIKIIPSQAKLLSQQGSRLAGEKYEHRFSYLGADILIEIGADESPAGQKDADHSGKYIMLSLDSGDFVLPISEVRLQANKNLSDERLARTVEAKIREKVHDARQFENKKILQIVLQKEKPKGSRLSSEDTGRKLAASISLSADGVAHAYPIFIQADEEERLALIGLVRNALDSAIGIKIAFADEISPSLTLADFKTASSTTLDISNVEETRRLISVSKPEREITSGISLDELMADNFEAQSILKGLEDADKLQALNAWRNGRSSNLWNKAASILGDKFSNVKAGSVVPFVLPMAAVSDSADFKQTLSMLSRIASAKGIKFMIFPTYGEGNEKLIAALEQIQKNYSTELLEISPVQVASGRTIIGSVTQAIEDQAISPDLIARMVIGFDLSLLKQNTDVLGYKDADAKLKATMDLVGIEIPSDDTHAFSVAEFVLAAVAVMSGTFFINVEKLENTPFGITIYVIRPVSIDSVIRQLLLSKQAESAA